MTRNLVVILTEGGKEKGWGHLSRCKALAQAFDTQGFSIHAVINGDASVKNYFDGFSTDFYNWEANAARWQRQIQGAKVVIVDSYSAKRSLYKYIAAQKKSAPIFFDDFQRLNYPNGIILNASVGAEKVRYLKSPGGMLLRGGKFSLVRKEFWKKSKKKARRKISNILITFGGINRPDFTVKLLKELAVSFPQAKFHIITPNTAKKSLMLGGRFVSKSALQFYANVSASKMRQLMLKCDLAISGGGQTLNELACCGVPVIGICFAENQKHHLLSWERTGFVGFGGNFDDKQIFLNIKKITQKLTYSRRKKMAYNVRSIVDGKGAMRVVSFVKKQIKENERENKF